MTKRLQTLLSALTPCRKLADVGCDHGYLSKAALDSGLAEAVVVSDISSPSLEKARALLAPYGERVRAVVCDGLPKVDADCDQVVIAGMGGEEIISILSSAPFLPSRLVLQPMKNADKLRKRLLLLGYRIERDYVFKDEKFYTLIAAVKGEDAYTDDEIFFGRDNLKDRSPDFMELAQREYQKYCALCGGVGLSESVRAELEALKNKYGEILK